MEAGITCVLSRVRIVHIFSAILCISHNILHCPVFPCTLPVLVIIYQKNRALGSAEPKKKKKKRKEKEKAKKKRKKVNNKKKILLESLHPL